jgi:hypothetical protein
VIPALIIAGEEAKGLPRCKCKMLIVYESNLLEKLFGT